MDKRYVVSAVLVLVLGTFSFIVADVQEDTKAKKVEKVEKSLCLACHGSFDDIAAATADYKAPSGETVTPHQYVTHEEKKDIPECIECHEPHPIPPESENPAVKPDNIDWCYTSCHHINTLQACSVCH